MRRTIRFEWQSHEEALKQLIYSKSKNNSTGEAVFSIFEISTNLEITESDIEPFKKWLIDKRIAIFVEHIGHNMFSCIATDQLQEEYTNKNLFK